MAVSIAAPPSIFDRDVLSSENQSFSVELAHHDKTTGIITNVLLPSKSELQNLPLKKSGRLSLKYKVTLQTGQGRVFLGGLRERFPECSVGFYNQETSPVVASMYRAGEGEESLSVGCAVVIPKVAPNPKAPQLGEIIKLGEHSVSFDEFSDSDGRVVLSTQWFNSMIVVDLEGALKEKYPQCRMSLARRVIPKDALYLALEGTARIEVELPSKVKPTRVKPTSSSCIIL